ncbi:hypothetical protein [Legionella yabuuchiae]|uniref:hypothetical protein n=1 Tax=Legionella yabuuchiae TaxID=376727 RepID=UPI001055780E|nr:hypothetical protein [Legionella yabuuchiae]
MQLSRLHKFSHDLSLVSDKTKEDRDLLETINTFLETLETNTRSEQVELSPEQDQAIEDYVIKLFARRRKMIKDTPDDYTLSNSTANQLWVAYAQDLEDLPNRTYLQILFPEVTNKKDPNTLNFLHESKDLQSFYLAEDELTLCQVSGLLSRTSHGLPLSTYRQNKLSKTYPLSIKELSRLRPKPERSVSIHYRGYEYTTFWAYLERSAFEKWEAKGKPPRMAVVELYELLQYFFDTSSRSRSEFRTRVLALNNTLEEYPVDDVNAFYGQGIEVEGGSFLINILLDCLVQDFSTLLPKMLGVAKWVAQFDASFILNIPTMRPFYESLHLGPGFTVDDLSVHIQRLIESHSEYEDDLAWIMRELQSSQSLNKAIIKAIIALYGKRWPSIMGTKLDYTNTGADDPWKKLAQCLSGADLVPKDYYLLLMPTLKTTFDPIGKQSTVNFSLDDTLLSEDGQELIYLPYCKRQLETQGTFYVPSVVFGPPPRPLSKIEKERLKLNSKYRRYLKTYEQDAIDPLAISTVLAIWNLVNRSLYPIGLLYAQNYSPIQLTAAEQAFDEFQVFYEALPSRERTRLDNHTIIYHGQKKTFGVILDQVHKDECVALSCRWFLQLVVDYFPWMKFRKDIEASPSVSIDEIRLASQKRLISKNGGEKLISQLQKIYISLLSHRFLERTHRITGFDYRNDVPGIGLKLFNLLDPFFMSEHFKSAHETYIELIKMVNEALTNEVDSLHTDTRRWLKTIMTEELFINSFWLDLKVMLTIFPILMPNNLTMQDAVIKAMISQKHPVVRELYFNLFCLRGLDAQAIGLIKSWLENNPINLGEDDVLLTLNDLIAKRLSQEGSKCTRARLGFHHQRAVVKKDWERVISNGFKFLPETVESVTDLLPHVENTLFRLRVPLTQHLQQYWYNLTSRRLVPVTLSSTSEAPSFTL